MAEQAPRTGRWLRAALGLSLAVNLLVVGLIAGAAYRFHGPHAVPHGMPRGAMHSYGTPYIMALPDDRRRAVFRDLRGKKDGGDMSRAARRALYDQVILALRAVPYEQQQVTQLLDRQRKATLRVQEASQTAWLAELAGMSDAERAAYADRLQDVLSRGRKRMHGGQKRRMGD